MPGLTRGEMARTAESTSPRPALSLRALDCIRPAVVPVVVFLAFAMWTLSVVTTAGYDEAIFLDVARSIRATGLPERSVAPDGLMFFEHTPLYPYLLSLVSWAGEGVARSLSVALGAATVGLVAAMVGGWGGLVAGLLLATNPLVVRMGTSIAMEALFMLLVAASVWMLSRGRVGWAGVVAALAVLAKEFALVYVAVASLWVLRAHGWRAALVFGLPSAAAFAGWLLWAAAIDPERLGDVLARWVGSASGEVGSYRTAVSAGAWATTQLMQVFTPVTVAIAALALPFAARRRGIAGLATGYVVAAVALGFVVALKEPRWLVATLPALAIAAGLAIPWTRGRAIAAVVATALVAPLLLMVMVDGRLHHDAFLAGVRAEAEAATDAVVSHPTQATVMGWYSGRPYVLPPR